MAGAKHRLRKERFNYFKAAMFFITLGVMPLIVCFIDMTPSPEELYVMPGSVSNQDMFSYYKSWMFAVCTAVLGLNSLWDFVSSNRDFDYRRCLKNPFTVGYAVFFIIMLIAGVINNFSGGGPAPSNQAALFLALMFVYTLIFFPLILISAFKDEFDARIPRAAAVAAVVFLMCVFATAAFTDYRHLTYYGAIERCEGVFALLGYIVILAEVAGFASEKRGAAVILASLIFSAAAIGVIGFFQLIGMDFFRTDIAMRLVLGEAYGAGMRLTPRMREAYATLYNPNCVGIYSAMMGPFAFAAACLLPKKSPLKYILFAASAFGFICLFGSNSSSGLIGSIAALGTFAALLFANFVKNRRGLKIPAVFTVAAVATGVVLMLVPATSSRITQMADKFVILPQTDAERGYFSDLEFAGDTARIFHGANSISITAEDDGKVVVKDAAGNAAEPVSVQPASDGSGGAAQYSLAGWPQFSLTVTQSVLAYREGGFTLYMGVDENIELVPLYQGGEALDLSAAPPSLGFENYQLFASSRGYIWSKALPVALKHILVGAGVDSFVIAFPQKDIVGKARFFNNPYMIVDKAHNMYLQTWVNTGLVSSLAQIALFASFLFYAVKTLVSARGISTVHCAVLMGAASGVVGFLVTGMTTDSVISVSPIFWAVLGMGYACVYAVRRENSLAGQADYAKR